MPEKIFKYPLNSREGPQVVMMPHLAKILYVADQRGQLCVWVLVDTYNSTEPRWFEVIGTGYEVPEAAKRVYIGSTQQLGGALVWHVFEVTG